MAKLLPASFIKTILGIDLRKSYVPMIAQDASKIYALQNPVSATITPSENFQVQSLREHWEANGDTGHYANPAPFPTAGGGSTPFIDGFSVAPYSESYEETVPSDIIATLTLDNYNPHPSDFSTGQGSGSGATEITGTDGGGQGGGIGVGTLPNGGNVNTATGGNRTTGAGGTGNTCEQMNSGGQCFDDGFAHNPTSTSLH